MASPNSVLEEKVEAAPAPHAEHRAAFFRQSGWLMIANVGGGMLMWFVHFLAKKIPDAEYGLFGVFLAVAMFVPTMPMQMALAHQTAMALATGRQRQLVSTIRAVWLWTLILWCVGCLAVVAAHGTIIERWKVTNPAILWITLPVILLSLWFPMFSGVLQGQQNFLWLGGGMLINGVGRLGLAAAAVLVLGGYAAGMMSGVLAGLALATTLCAWQCRALWLGESQPSDGRALLREIVPPMLGFAAFQFLFTADTMFVKAYFSGDEAGFYFSAGTLSRALIWLVGPLATVMFPRIVHSVAKSEKSDLMPLVLLGTAVLAAGGAACLTLLGPWVVKLVYKPSYVQTATQVLPWYAGAMVPLALANVLINNLMARSRFKIVPVLCVLAVAYGLALTFFNDRLVTVLKTLGVFGLVLLGVSAWFNFGMKEKASERPGEGQG